MSAARRRWLALAVLCVSLLVIVIDNTIVNVALPTLVIVVTPRTSSRAAAMAGSAMSPSRSIQKTYSHARSRLGRDSSLRMFRP